MKVTQLSDLPANSNPFLHDSFNMGTKLGKDTVVMHKNFPDQECPYLIICDVSTGKRLRVDFTEVTDETPIPELWGRESMGVEELVNLVS